MSQVPHSDQGGMPHQTEPLRKKRFWLSRRDWAVFIFGAAVVLAMQPFQRSASYPLVRLVPYIFGQVTGLLIISILPSLLAFYLSRRSRTAASTTFVIFVALGATAQVDAVLRNGGRPLDDEAVLNQVAPRFLQWMKDQMAPYQRACNKLEKMSPLLPGQLKERTDLANAREQIQRVRKASDDLRDLCIRAPQRIQELLAAQGVPERDRSRLATAMSDQFIKNRALFAALRDSDDAITAGLLKACDVLDENWGRWHYDADAGVIAFENDATDTEFNAIVARLQEVGQKQEQDRAEYLRRLHVYRK